MALKNVKLRLEKMSSELNISIMEIYSQKKHEIENLAVCTDKLNLYSKLKILEYLEDLEHICATGKNIIDLVLLEVANELTTN